MFVLKSVEKVEKRREPGVTSVFLTASDTWMERGKFKHVESLGIPQFRGIGVGVDPTIPPVEFELEHSNNQFQRFGIGVSSCELTPIIFQ